MAKSSKQAVGNPTTNDTKSPKYLTGQRYFGKGIGKVPRSLTLSPDPETSAPEIFKGDRQKRWRMYLNAYENAFRTGDKRRLRGIRSMGIIVHAEKVDPNWRMKLNLADKKITTLDDLARMVHDRFIAAQQNAAHLVFVKNNVIKSHVSFPKGYPQSMANNPQALQDSIVKSLGNTRPQDTDGYYLVENHPDAKLTPDETQLHKIIANKMNGYLGGILLKPGFDYGLVTMQNGQFNLQNKQLPLPITDTEEVQGYDGPYTVLANHQDLIGHPVHVAQTNKMSDRSISQIANKIERARDTTLLIYADKGKTTGIQEIPNPLIKKAKKFDDFLTEQMQKYNADQVVAVLDSTKVNIAKPAANRTVKKLGIDLQVAARDVVKKTVHMVDMV